jgi:RNA polymerase sigma-70 factor, ECF subfamily
MNSQQKIDEIDELTLRRAQRGDAAACRSLVEQYQRRVFGLCLRVIGGRDHALAQDAAQETFIDVFAKLANFQTLGPARLSTWILTIASRRAIDLSRARASHQQLISAAGQTATQSARLAQAPSRAGIDIELALQELTAEHRAVFLLCDAYEFTYEEAAKALQLEIGTVKSRLARARQAARSAVARDACDASDASDDKQEPAEDRPLPMRKVTPQ